MKFSLIILLVLIVSCKQTTGTKYEKKTYFSKGFAYIYNEKDYENKIINNSLNEFFCFKKDQAIPKKNNPRIRNVFSLELKLIVFLKKK